MGLFDFFGKKNNKKMDIDGQEVVDFTDLTVPVPVVHSNQIDEGHDVFAKAINDYKKEVSLAETEAEVVRDIKPLEGITEVEDLSSMNQGESKVEENPIVIEKEPAVEEEEKSSSDMSLFKACLEAEVKRKRSTSELETDEEIYKFCHDRMVSYKEGTFDYPEDVKKSIQKMIDAKNMVQNMMMPKSSSDEVSIRKVA